MTEGRRATDGLANRQKSWRRLPGAVLVRASKVLEDGLPHVDVAPLVMVYHNAIDKRGDARDTEGEVFAACEDAISQVAEIVASFLRAGCGKVTVIPPATTASSTRTGPWRSSTTPRSTGRTSSTPRYDVSARQELRHGRRPAEERLLIEILRAELSLNGAGGSLSRAA